MSVTSSVQVRRNARCTEVGLSGKQGVLLAALLLVAACGPATEEDVAVESLGASTQALLTENGLSTNGLSTNGLSTNGLSTNGLSTNGLSNLSFKNWFNADVALRNVVMQYIVLCGLAQGQTLTWTNPQTNVAYTWAGRFGLAPVWASGSQPTTNEQQLVSACLAAHTNKYGLNIDISVLGRNSTGATIAYTSQELAAFPEREACFFGNLFTNQGIYAANDRAALRADESTSRACGLSSSANSSECPPIAHLANSCASYCTLDASGDFYTSCTYNGVTFKPLTTRIRSQDIYRCGDGVCQFTESCGTSTTYNSCVTDCGLCSPL
jgi:hypothetical protein